MRRLFSQSAKVAWSSHQTFTKVVQPNPVDEHSGRKRVVAIGHGRRQLQSAASLVEGKRFVAGKNTRESSRSYFAGFAEVAADGNLHVGGAVVLQNMNTGWSCWCGAFKVDQLRIPCCQLPHFTICGSAILFLQAVAKLVGFLCDLRYRLLVLLEFTNGLGRADRRQLNNGIIKNSCQRVIVLCGERIEFVVVASGACNR